MSDENIIAVFALGQGEITSEQLVRFFKEKDDADYLEIVDVDFVNPFLDGSDVKFTDNSGNCTIVASGTDWTTLAGVQASID